MDRYLVACPGCGTLLLLEELQEDFGDEDCRKMGTIAMIAQCNQCGFDVTMDPDKTNHRWKLWHIDLVF